VEFHLTHCRQTAAAGIEEKVKSMIAKGAGKPDGK